MTTQELQEKMEQAMRDDLESTGGSGVGGMACICSEIAQQAITEAVAEAVAEKEKKIQELFDFLNLKWSELSVFDYPGNVSLGAGEMDAYSNAMKKMQELGLISNQH